MAFDQNDLIKVKIIRDLISGNHDKSTFSFADRRSAKLNISVLFFLNLRSKKKANLIKNQVCLSLIRINTTSIYFRQGYRQHRCHQLHRHHH